MQVKTGLFKAVCIMLLLGLPVAAKAQSSSLNTYSPYSFYGIGDITTPGNTMLRSMGGAGIAYRSSVSTNYMNPASYSAIPRNVALLGVGLEGQNYYLKDSNTKSSFNSFNIRDITLQLPIGKKLGFAASFTPYSSVGYRVQRVEDVQDVGADIGYVKYLYGGSGGTSQIKAGLGWQVLKNLSVGAELLYLHGNIERTYAQSIYPITGTGSYNSLSGTDSEKVRSIYGNFGVQATVISKNTSALVLGATYQTGGKIRGDITRSVPFYPTMPSGSNFLDTVRYVSSTSSYVLPHIVGAGFYYHRTKWSVGGDYVYSMWGQGNSFDDYNNIGFRDTHTVRIGGQITPNPGDVRYMLRRWTYRAGFRYDQYYMVINNQKIDTKAITLGLGIPLDSRALNVLNLGLELGTKGHTRSGMVKENFFKFSIGFNFFGEDFWFMKQKYD